MSEFLTFCEKSTTYDIRCMSLCPKKDLLGVITEDDSIIVFRISHKTQKVASIEEEYKAMSLCFHENGEGLCIGSEEGQLKVFKLSSEGFHLISKHNLDSGALSNLLWTTYSGSIQSTSLETNDLLPGASLAADKLFSSFSILAAYNKAKVALLANGAMPIACIDMEKAISRPVELCSMRLFPNLNSFVCLFLEENFLLGIFNCIILDKRAQCFMETAYTHSLCSELLKKVATGVKEVQKDWQFVKNSFVSRYLQGLEDVNSDSVETIQELLFQTAATGDIPPVLAKAIKEEMQTPKLTQQVLEKLSTLFNNITVILLEDLLNPSEAMCHYLHRLQALSNSVLYSHVPFNSQVVSDLLKLIGYIYEIMRQVSESYKNIVNLLNWLQNCSIAIVKEEEQTGPLEEQPVDIKQLLNFVGDSESLYLEKLSQAFRPMNGNLQSLVSCISELWTHGIIRPEGGLSEYFLLERLVDLTNKPIFDISLSLSNDTVIVLISKPGGIREVRVKNLNIEEVEHTLRIPHNKLFEYYTGNKKILVSNQDKDGASISLVDLSAMGNVVKTSKFLGQDISCIAFSKERGLVCLLMNEKSLKLIDLEES